MLGLSFASVPLYRLFCQVTGFGGTTQKASELLAQKDRGVSGREVTVRFNADTNRDFPCDFRPLQVKIRVKVGENAMAYYESINDTDQPVAGMATYNVTPDKTGKYFNKIACFCFEEQTLLPKQRVEMPVLFFIDPAFDKDPEMADVDTITLSYTFFKYKK
jgi:cytochrome c oxidase assembly protein subunit 11